MAKAGTMPALQAGRERMLHRGASALLSAALLLGAGSARADEDDPAARVAEIAALAEIAPTVCTGLETRLKAVEGWLKHAGLAQSDLTGRYADEAKSIAQSFLDSARDDQDAACTEILRGLGDAGLGLLAKKAN